MYEEYEELVRLLKDRAEGFDYDGWVETAVALEKAAEAIEELQKAVYFHKYNSEFWEDKYNTLADEKWIPVMEALPESVDDDVLVTDGEGCAVGYWRPDAQAWDSTDFGWLENRSEPPCGIHTVTHWMPLPKPPKEE